MGGKTVFCTLESHANALATNREATQVVVAGRNVFKIFGIDDSDEFVECLNLRVGKNLNLNFSCADVTWNPVEDNILATAATNGAVVTWNLNKTSRSKQDMVFQDHKRTVNKVCFHPVDSYLLLSGSQDGTMKCFDLRRREAVSTFLSLSESVRDVQFSPSHSYMFAAVQENGNVQLWDLRRTDRCERQFTAHHGPVFSCDWHPEERRWLATAGRDKTIKVWDAFKPKQLDYTVYTIASVARIRWRPQMKYNIASSSLVVDFSVNIWDIRRPYVPFAAFMEHKDVATGFAWRNDPNILLSTSKDCTLYQHAFRDAIRPDEHANPIGLDINSCGDISFALSEKLNGDVGGLIKGNNYSSTRVPMIFRKTPSHNEQFQSASSSVTVLLNNDEKNLSMKWFVDSAHRYQFTGRPLGDLCDHNANVAVDLERYQVAQSWRILKVLYGGGVLLGPDSSWTLTPSASMGEGLRNADEEKGANDSQDGTNRSSRHNSGNTTIHNRHYSGHSGGKSGNRHVSGNAGNAGMSDRQVVDTSGQTEEDSEGSDAEQDRTLITNAGNGLRNIQGDFFFGDGDASQLLNFDYNAVAGLDGSHDWSLPSEAFQPKHPIKDCSPPPEIAKAPSSPASMDEEEYEVDNTVVNSDIDDQSKVLTISCIPPLPTWSFTDLVTGMLQFYAAEGDVQMSVTVLLVLGNKAKGLVEESVQEQWFISYIDMLCRFQLWNVCNEVIRFSNIGVINSMNQQSTSFHMLCGNCKRQLTRVGWLCDRCKMRPAPCSICHQVVHGLFVWCQGCAHGGHVQHMKEWFQLYPMCPAGCGHLCEYT